VRAFLGSPSAIGASGIQTFSLLGNPNRGGITPTTVCGRALMVICRPTSAGSP
jgi:hypothetical protein